MLADGLHPLVRRCITRYVAAIGFALAFGLHVLRHGDEQGDLRLSMPTMLPRNAVEEAFKLFGHFVAKICGFRSLRVKPI